MFEQNESLLYEFAGFSVDVTRRQLVHKGKPVPLTSKAFDTLLMLVSQRGTTVSKSELMNSVWADTVVEENNLTQQISVLRRVLGERPDDHRFIVTVPGRGYCFVADILQDPVEDEVKMLRRRQSTIVGDRSITWFVNIDAGAVTGYALAILLIALIGLGFLWSSFRNFGFNRPQSLAVLNFKVSASGDEFIGNGISETLRARLGSVQDLTVRLGDTVSADQDALAIGRSLQVDTVVTGSVQRDRDRIRVAVEMLDVAAGRIVWGKTFDDSASNLFALQDSIAGEVARVLNISFVSRRDPSFLRALAEWPKMLCEMPKIRSRKPEITSV
jgi:DNA-binding winged helix-turn-helix (wHTH) protein/TolB-like protein